MSRLSNEEARIDAEERREMAASIEFLVQTPQFRLFIRRFLLDNGALENHGLGPNVFSSNALLTAHEAGKLATLQELVRYLAAVSPDFYATVLKEHAYAAAARRTRLDRYAADEPDSDE